MAVMYILRLLIQCPEDTDSNPHTSVYLQDIGESRTKHWWTDMQLQFAPFNPLLPFKTTQRNPPDSRTTQKADTVGTNPPTHRSLTNDEIPDLPIFGQKRLMIGQFIFCSLDSGNERPSLVTPRPA